MRVGVHKAAHVAQELAQARGLDAGRGDVEALVEADVAARDQPTS